MRSRARWITGTVAGLTLLVGGIAPAVARDHHRPGGYGYPGDWGGYPYRHRPYRGYDRGLGAGDVIGIAALIGAVAVIASAASKKRDAPRRYPDVENAPHSADRGQRDGDDDYVSGGASSMSEDEAVDACVEAARNKAEGERGGYAEVRSATPQRASGQDGWSVDGRIEIRRNYQDQDGATRRFSCDVEGGRVANVYISRDTA